MSEYHSIPLKPDTADKIHEHKQRGESWDETVRRLIDDGD